MKIVTFNLRHHSDRWTERFPLVVETLLATKADLIGLQEVSMKLGPKNQAELIVDEMNRQLGREVYQFFFQEGRGELKGREGIAILSKIPVLSVDTIELPLLWRVAQLVKVMCNGKIVSFLNTHLHHEPLHNESIRYPQVKRLLSWAEAQGGPSIIAGDFNAQPNSLTIELVKEKYSSSYEVFHGEEPEFTFPTPLVNKSPRPGEKEMIDYIFFNSSYFNVDSCQLIGDNPSPSDISLYPSDHYGILCVFKNIRVNSIL